MQELQIGGLSIYKSVFEFIDSNMYVIIEKEEAIVVDPHKDKSISDLLKDMGVNHIDIILTHEHTDHISGIYWLQKLFRTTLICQSDSAKYISGLRSTRPMLISFILEERDRNNGTNWLEKFNSEYEPHTYKADVTFDEEMDYKWHNHFLKLKHIPGHSKGSSYICLDNSILFTGDSLLGKQPVITRFPGGSTAIYLARTIPILESLDKKLIVLPGHGDMFLLKDMYNNNHLDVEIK